MKNFIGLGHFGFCAHDKEATIKFYTEVMGFEVITDNEISYGRNASYFLRRGNLVLEFFIDPDNERNFDGPVDHLSFLVDDLDAAIAELKTKGVQFDSDEIHFDPDLYERGERFVMFRGPSGERLQLEQIL